VDFPLKQELKYLKNPALYVHGFCVVKNLWKIHNGDINSTISQLATFITRS
jgi:hypothetical protein